MDDLTYRGTAFAGFFMIALIAWATGDRNAINRKTIGGSLCLAWGIGVLTFWLPWTRSALEWVNDILITTLQASQKGSIFLFGPLAVGPGQALPDGTQSIGFVLAIQVLPSVIFFSAVVSALYYLGAMQACVNGFARVFHKLMALSGAEALSASANIFVGIESGLAIRPYLDRMSRSELLTLITCMMATVASTVMAVYIIALQNVFPQIAGHLISASIISIPCAVLISKLTLPETEVPQTMGSVPHETLDARSLDHLQGEPPEKPSNLMVALIDGGSQGVKLAIGIATLLIVVLGMEAVIDLALKQIPIIAGEPVSMARILGWLTWPFIILLGLKPDEWQIGAQILGSRFIETEVTAYFQLAALQSGAIPAFSLRSFTALTYTLCGFVHIASLGIFVGGLAAIVPSRAREISLIGIRGLWTAFLATLLTGCIAGVLVQI
jgi:CNT family concentrative nucleoside transporter